MLSDMYIQSSASSGANGASAATSYSSSASASAGSNQLTTSVRYTPVFTGRQRPQHRAGRRHDSGNHAQFIQLRCRHERHSAQRAFTQITDTTEAFRSTIRGNFLQSRCRSTLRPTLLWERRSATLKKWPRSFTSLPACNPTFRAPQRLSTIPLSNEALLILAALVTVYIVLGVLYESFIHPVTILSTLPRLVLARFWRLCSAARI